MITKWSDALLSIVSCPKCRSRIVRCADGGHGNAFKCSNLDCKLAKEGFPVLNGQPVLIDFDASIVDRAGIVTRNGGSVQNRDVQGTWIRTHVHRLLCGHNHNARRIAAELTVELKKRKRKPRVLIVGGGTIGTGSSPLCTDRDIEVISLDIYASPHTTFVADGHRLPLADGCVDAVWIQAVLEHVLDPSAVVAEIHRVLKPDGTVFADTPFMQQVHEGIYDFTRFTLHGHRWLFRRFTVIDAGVTRGAGTGLVWSIRYFMRALARNSRVGTLLTLPFFWLRYADQLLDDGMSAEGASGVFFLGRRAERSISPKDMVGFYDELRQLHDARPLGPQPRGEPASAGAQARRSA
jgi:SAM-dependent methyltransferase